MEDSDDRGPSPAIPAKQPRQERLKRALRENLKRRKSQARERSDFTHESCISDEVARDDDEESPAK
jgi:hypothetical protein